LASDPTNQQMLTLLGEICFRMGDLPAAGSYWFLTDAHGEDVNAAHTALLERHRGPVALFNALPLRAPLEAYPEGVQARLRPVLNEAGPVVGKWSRKFGRVSGPDAPPGVGAPTGIGMGVILVAVVGPWLVGVGAVIWLIVQLVRSIL
jgi:hypothetical protein